MGAPSAEVVFLLSGFPDQGGDELSLSVELDFIVSVCVAALEGKISRSHLLGTYAVSAAPAQGAPVQGAPGGGQHGEIVSGTGSGGVGRVLVCLNTAYSSGTGGFFQGTGGGFRIMSNVEQTLREAKLKPREL
jgi:hypothetical protein